MVENENENVDQVAAPEVEAPEAEAPEVAPEAEGGNVAPEDNGAIKETVTDIGNSADDGGNTAA